MPRYTIRLKEKGNLTTDGLVNYNHQLHIGEAWIDRNGKKYIIEAIEHSIGYAEPHVICKEL